MNDSPDPTRAELDDQLKWFESHASRSRQFSLALRVLNAGIAVAIAFILGYTDVPVIVPGGLAALVALLEVIDGAVNPRGNWLRYRDAAEDLREQRTLYDARAGAYANAERPAALLADRLTQVRARERRAWRKWAEAQDDAKVQQAARRPPTVD